MMWIAVVGTRMPSPAAVRLTKDVVRALAMAGFGIVTGGARGIDYYAEHYAELFKAPLKVIRPSDPTRRGSYVERDREIAEVADAVVVIEARAGTARFACCGTQYPVDFAIELRKHAYIFKPLVDDADVWEAFNILVKRGAIVVSSIDDLIQRLRSPKQGVVGP
jgi:predicted Rossmann fold nucleotide-binding protein DprA/Smf involved in DNA uptake